MKEKLITYWKEITNRTEDKSIVLIICFGYFILLGFWNSFDNFSPFLDQIKSIFAVAVSILIAAILFFSNLLAIAYFKRKSTYNFSWYLDNLYVLGNKKIWENKIWWKIFIPIQLTNFILLHIYPEKYTIWLSFIPIVIFGSLLTAHIERHKEILTFLFGNFLFALSVFVIFNFRLLGVYFYWLFTGHDCFVNYGFEEPNNPLSNIEFFWQIRDWERYGNPLPDEDNQLAFKTFAFWDTVIFHLYPILILLTLFNTHYIFGKIASLNLNIERIKIQL